MRFRDTPALKVFLIRATGRYFCAGADLRSGMRNAIPQTHSARGIRENHRIHLDGMHRIHDETEHIEKRFVVAHHGIAWAAGWKCPYPAIFASPRRARAWRMAR